MSFQVLREQQDFEVFHRVPSTPKQASRCVRPEFRLHYRDITTALNLRITEVPILPTLRRGIVEWTHTRPEGFVHGNALARLP